jgi:hypothetical protein
MVGLPVAGRAGISSPISLGAPDQTAPPRLIVDHRPMFRGLVARG